MNEKQKKDLKRNLNSSDFEIDKVYTELNKQNVSIEPEKNKVNNKNKIQEVNNKLLSDFNLIKIFYNKEIDELRKMLNDPHNYSEIEIRVHGLRQKLLDERYDLKNTQIKNSFKIKKYRKDSYEFLKTQSNIHLKNKSDIDLYIDASEQVILYTMIDNIISNFMEWAEQTVKSIDNLRWSIKNQFEIKKWIAGEN